MTTQYAERTRLLDRVPVEEITAAARRASPSRTILGIIGGIIYGVAWLTAKIFHIAFLALAWCTNAAVMGVRNAQGKPLLQPNIEDVLRENAMLRAENARLS
jgi:hypothetical protein